MEERIEESLFIMERTLALSIEAEEVDFRPKNSPIQNHPDVVRLNAQLNDYPRPAHGYGASDLNKEGVDALFKGVTEYRKAHAHLPLDYYRKQFIEHVVQVMEDKSTNYKGSDSVRRNAPELATISAEKLLGKEGLKLYQLALKEEFYSAQYRRALFNSATNFTPGETQGFTSYMDIGGVSGCGKSVALKVVNELINQIPQKIGNSTGTLSASEDGGLAREISQMRKLLIQLANIKGYTGVSDLHSQSKILDHAKTLIKEAVLADKKFSLVRPETFSGWINPLDKNKAYMEEMIKSDRVVFFAQVVPGVTPDDVISGKPEDIFKEVVAFMGSRRAWKTEGFNKVTLDLNNTENLKESKAYGANGFYFGKTGTEKAAKAYEELQIASGNPVLRMDVLNDLILLRKKTEHPPEVWVQAKAGDEDVLLVSQRVFNAWRASSINEKARGLREFNSSIRTTRPELAKPVIKVSPDLQNALDGKLDVTKKTTAYYKKEVEKAKEEFKEKETKSIYFGLK